MTANFASRGRSYRVCADAIAGLVDLCAPIARTVRATPASVPTATAPVCASAERSHPRTRRGHAQRRRPHRHRAKHGTQLTAGTTTTPRPPLAGMKSWIKTPGRSDGTCDGGPPAGTWWPSYALALAQRAAY
jgi:cellulase/cellobiase CelA1